MAVPHARLQRSGKVFLVLLPDASPTSPLISEPTIFHNITTGERVSTKTLHQSFGTTDANEITNIILRDGRLQQASANEHALTSDTFYDEVVSILSNDFSIANTSNDPMTWFVHRILNDHSIKVAEAGDPHKEAWRLARVLMDDMDIHPKEAVSCVLTIPAQLYRVCLESIRQNAEVVDVIEPSLQTLQAGKGAVKLELQVANYHCLLREICKKTNGRFGFQMNRSLNHATEASIPRRERARVGRRQRSRIQRENKRASHSRRCMGDVVSA